ncbi:hypothetical protein [uncultured Bacteroides sp.]|nr:hypothetical protein [uncultured Bacteroides sp.]
MKAFIFALSVALSLSGSAQNKHQIYSIDGNRRIIPVESMINPIGYERIEFNGYHPSQFVTVGSTRYAIKIATDELEDKGSGFNVIEIHKGTEKLMELRDIDMWTYMYAGKSATNYRKYTDNRYFIPLELKPDIKALCFVGWPYGGDLSLLTIVVLTENEAKLVFNKRVSIVTMAKEEGEYTLKVQTNLEEFDSSGVQVIFQEYTTMNSKDGILYIGDFEE